MRLIYKLNDEDLKEYFASALKNDPDVVKHHWRLRLLIPTSIVIVLIFTRPELKWTLTLVALAVIWLLGVELYIYPIYVKKITEHYMAPARMKIEKLTVDVTEEYTAVNKQRVKLIDYAVFPTVFVMLFEGGANVIIPNRALDNDINKLNELIALVDKQLFEKKEKSEDGK